MSSQAGTWLKMLGVGIVICVGGPALVQNIRPTDEELFKRYNPDLQKRSLEEGDRRAQEFDEYVTRLKQWSKSDKSSKQRPWSSLLGRSLRLTAAFWIQYGLRHKRWMRRRAWKRRHNGIRRKRRLRDSKRK
ncbi:CBP4-domain-containing protein [Aspergillus crustosus]